ncbi:MAG: hypothetical protein UT42_C0009G0012 [Candidatus Falkowbacteria bacterium GW2011_GWA2_39_24]|uniref:Baseplate protein J-like domain-containing protein n=1 Tax=Candidatus Falkowbacteria bacterium GW2011_GWA2_39_24 TaxID=1618634 RepID=A0A0G0QXU1_9BACT|nr:MAG: hypothetical protein UT42_C0009G0012 [Candidatus Falkowbacteria bacterium GW2011_GWA2_39_24]
MPSKKLAAWAEEPAKAVAKPGIKKIKSGKPKLVKPSVGKPKIKIKKVSHKAKLDASVINLKKPKSSILAEEDGDLLEDDEEIEETPVTEDMDFDWEELLDADGKGQKYKKEVKANKKSKLSKFKGGFLPFFKKHSASTVEHQDKTDKVKPKADKSFKAPTKIEELAIILIAVIGYFSFVKATVIIKLAEETVDQSAPFNIYDRGEDYVIPEDAVRGIIKEIELEQSKVYDVVGSEIIGQEVTGTVTLVNNYMKNQPLVATTRLLSPEGQLFRLKSSVMVPAGRTITAEVYADKPGEDMVVGDTHFTIPGLWEGLQDQIYAESKAGDITFKKKLKKIVKQEEINSALADMKETLIAKAKTDIDQTYSDYQQKLYQINEDNIEYEVDAEVGDEMDKFTVTMKAVITVVAFADSQVYELTQTALASSLTDNKQLLGLRSEEFTYELTSVDLEKDTAEVKVSFKAKIAYANGSEIINKEEIVNMSREELSAYLSKMPEISTFDIKISPSFINKTPSLVDRIKIEVIN